MPVDPRKRDVAVEYIGYVRLSVLLLLLGGIACARPATRIDSHPPPRIAG